MTISERVKRGFWRIGLVGAVPGAAIAFGVLVFAAWNFMFGEVSVHHDEIGYRIAVPAWPRAEVVIARVEEAHAKWRARPWSERLRDQPSTSPVERIAALAALEAQAVRRSQVLELAGVAAAAVGLGLLWLGLWAVLSWVVRGFLT